MNDCITTTKQRTTKPCAYFLGYTVRMVDDHRAGCDNMIQWMDYTAHKKFMNALATADSTLTVR